VLRAEPVDFGARTHRLLRDGQATRWDDYEHLTWWKTQRAYLVAADLSPADRASLLPPATSHPRAAALFASAPLLPVDDEARDVVAGRVVLVGFTRTADDYVLVEVARDRKTIAHVAGSIYSVIDSTLDPASTDEERTQVVEELDRDDFLDRILRAATGGAADLRAVALAGRLEDVRARPAALDALEEELAEVEARAATQREEARSIVEALAAARADETEVEVPVYGRARRVHKPQWVVRRMPRIDDLSCSVDVDDEDHLVLPAEDEWHVDDVEPWEPPSRAAHVTVAREALRQANHVHRVSPRTLYVFLAIAFVTAVLLVLLGR
jgi:hypothetical protein